MEFFKCICCILRVLISIFLYYPVSHGLIINSRWDRVSMGMLLSIETFQQESNSSLQEEGVSYQQGLDFHDMSSSFPCEIDNLIQYINLGYGAQAPKIVSLYIFLSFCVVFKFQVIFVILASFSCHIFKVYVIFSSFTEFIEQCQQLKSKHATKNTCAPVR